MLARVSLSLRIIPIVILNARFVILGALFVILSVAKDLSFYRQADKVPFGYRHAPCARACFRGCSCSGGSNDECGGTRVSLSLRIIPIVILNARFVILGALFVILSVAKDLSFYRQADKVPFGYRHAPCARACFRGCSCSGGSNDEYCLPANRSP